MKAITTIAALLALAACQQSDPNNIAIDEGNSLNADIETLPPDETPVNESELNAGSGLNEAEDDSENSPPTVAIPAQYHGRWGMTPADCDPGRSDAKGLLRIDAQTLRFYESVAALQERRPAIATSFAGVYSFTGEGQTWERVVTLTRTGDTLKRAQADGSFTYKRCA